MITPAGKECRFYYQDYFRGRSEQECRLIKANPRSPKWRPKDCATCPVPDILIANCSLHLIDVEKPEAGCPKCAAERPGLRELFDDLK